MGLDLGVLGDLCLAQVYKIKFNLANVYLNYPKSYFSQSQKVHKVV